MKTNKLLIIFYCANIIIHKLFNRGWRKISNIKSFEKYHSFYRLPNPGIYDIVVDNKIIYNHYYGGSISDDRYVESYISHFRKSVVHKLPKF